MNNPHARRWSAVASLACTLVVAGCWAAVAGLQWRAPGLQFLAGALLGLGGGIGSVIAWTWASWHREHGSEVCCIVRSRLTGTVHWHWPRPRIVYCRNQKAGLRVHREDELCP